MPTFREHVGARLREFRQDMGLSGAEAARQLGISHSLLSHYERGNKLPPLEPLSRICVFYGVTVDDVLPPSHSL